MKKKTKIITALSAVVCVILVTVLILSLIVVRPIESLGEYNAASVRVIDSYGYEQRRDDDLINDALGTVKFSIMRAVLEGGLGYDIKPVTFEDSEGETQRKQYTAAQFKAVTPAVNSFMLQVDFDTTQTSADFTDENGDKIKYNRIVMIIPQSGNQITKVKVYPYLKYNLDNENFDLDDYNDEGQIGMEYATVYEFTAKMYTYKMYNKLVDAEFQTGGGTAE